MASHLHPSTLKFPAHFSTTPPRKTPAKPKPIPLSKRPTHALQAQGRGFGPTTISNDKPKQTQGDSSGSGGNNSNEGKDEDDAIPQVVFNRMLVRILLFVGVPMALGVGTLYVLSTLREQGVWESPGWLPFLTLLLSFGTSTLGIAYGTLSASWDVENEGSLLGWEEARDNWPELWKEEENGKRQT